MDGVVPEARELNEELRRLCGALLDAVNTLYELRRPAVVPCNEFASRHCIEGIALPSSPRSAGSPQLRSASLRPAILRTNPGSEPTSVLTQIWCVPGRVVPLMWATSTLSGWNSLARRSTSSRYRQPRRRHSSKPAPLPPRLHNPDRPSRQARRPSRRC